MSSAQEQLTGFVKEWLTTENELKALKSEISAKRKRAKIVREAILNLMKQLELGSLQISSGRVARRTKTTKASMTKQFITETLVEFFEGDKALADKCAAFLDSKRPVRSTDNIQLEAIPHS